MLTLIKNGTIITGDSEFRVFQQGSILIQDDKILDIGFTEELQKSVQADIIIDASNKIIAPGFVSVHNHLGYTIFRGRAEDIGATPTPSLFLPMKQIIKKEERKIFAALNSIELLSGGVTTILEMEEDAEVVAPFLEHIGIRAGLAVMCNDVDVHRLLQGELYFDSKLRQQQIEQSTALIERYNNLNGKFYAFISANMALSCSKELLQALKKLAEKYSVGISYHVGLGAYEVDLVRKLHNCRPFEFARDVGFLDSNTIVAHCHYIDDYDIEILKKSNAAVAHCPVLNSLRGATAPVSNLIEKNIPIALGIDNYFSDYFDLMRACISVARVKKQDATFMTARDVFRLATIEGAKAMNLEKEIGSIEVGKKADLQFIKTNRLHLSPITDPVSALVYHAHAQDVDMVIVDGKILVSDGKILNVDETQIIDQAQYTSDMLWNRFATTYPELHQKFPQVLKHHELHIIN